MSKILHDTPLRRAKYLLVTMAIRKNKNVTIFNNLAELFMVKDYTKDSIEELFNACDKQLVRPINSVFARKKYDEAKKMIANNNLDIDIELFILYWVMKLNKGD